MLDLRYINDHTNIFRIKKELPVKTELRVGDLVSVFVEEMTTPRVSLSVSRAYTFKDEVDIIFTLEEFSRTLFDSYFEKDEEESKWVNGIAENYSDLMKDYQDSNIIYTSRMKILSMLLKLYQVLTIICVIFFVCLSTGVIENNSVSFAKPALLFVLNLIITAVVSITLLGRFLTSRIKEKLYKVKTYVAEEYIQRAKKIYGVSTTKDK